MAGRKQWIKANPNLGVSVQLDELRAVVNKAKGDAASLNGTLRLRLGLWTSAHTAWIPMDEWGKCSTVYTADDLAGQICFGGLDLSTTIDISALVLLFPPQKERKEWAVLSYFYLPEDNIEKRSSKDRVPYDVWAKQGLFKLTPGNIIDYVFIRADINGAATKFRIQEIAYDPYNATQIVTELGEEDGLLMVPFRQGDVSMNAPCKRLIELVLSGELAHGNTPFSLDG
jgi:phage terminase large subunit-like protein